MKEESGSERSKDENTDKGETVFFPLKKYHINSDKTGEEKEKIHYNLSNLFNGLSAAALDFVKMTKKKELKRTKSHK